MYVFIKVFVISVCVCGAAYIICMNTKYKNDNSSSKEDIINYFKEQQATSVEKGIKTKDLPIFIAKSSYLLMMVKDKTLIFKKGKYYLNSNR